ncbi:MAG: hypothetical protein QS748_12575 [Candidatus Endonucleobacter bathymodioli]|uniref:Uncharacterized protein n=1 Tax=Candidatus Endonucleibacter bathymodioli TaxID=539814 RepID=A0AA90P2L7_9GAMM|nr:hypothetical protein [Candidatus Endonucleobacter bathymodioli]
MSRQEKAQFVLGYTPEQITGLLILEPFPEAISHQTIYRLDRQNMWYYFLQRKGKSYLKHKVIDTGDLLLPNHAYIVKRPNHVDQNEDISS